MPSLVRQTHVDETETLHELGQLHPKATVILGTALDFLALLTVVNHTGPLRTSVRPVAVPFALAVRVAYAHELHPIARHLSHLACIDDAVGMVG